MKIVLTGMALMECLGGLVLCTVGIFTEDLPFMIVGATSLILSQTTIIIGMMYDKLDNQEKN